MSSPQSLASELRRAISVKAVAKEMRSLGLYDFVNYDHPQTDCPVLMATSLFFYTSVSNDSEAKWLEINCVLVGIIAFLKGKSGVSPSSADIRELKALLENPPILQTGFEAWCRQTFNID